MARAMISKDYALSIPEEIRRIVPLEPGQPVQVLAHHGVITLLPDRSTAGLPTPPFPYEPLDLDALAIAQGVKPVESVADLYGGWPEDQLEDGFEEAVRRWRDEALLDRE